MVETKFGGPPIVINHNIVPVFKLSDNLSLQTNFVMKQVIILTGNVGRCEFFFISSCWSSMFWRQNSQ